METAAVVEAAVPAEAEEVPARVRQEVLAPQGVAVRPAAVAQREVPAPQEELVRQEVPARQGGSGGNRVRQVAVAALEAVWVAPVFS